MHYVLPAVFHLLAASQELSALFGIAWTVERRATGPIAVPSENSPDSVRRVATLPRRFQDELEQGGNTPVFLDWVAQGQALADLVPIAATDADSLDVTGVLQVSDDALHSALSNRDLLGDIAHARFRRVDDADEHVGVVREECPLAAFHSEVVAPLRRQGVVGAAH